MRTPRHLALVVGTVIARSACAPAAPPTVDTAAEQAALKAATSTWIDAYNAGHVEKIVALYAEDAVLMPPHSPVAKWARRNTSVLERRHGRSESYGREDRARHTTAGVAGDTGWESGTYTVTDASGATVDSGSYLSGSHKSNGKWLYHRDTYNSDRPLPPPASVEAAKK